MFYFYRLKIIEYNRDISAKIDINKVIDKLQENYPRVNFIKFYYGESEDTVFLSDKELKGETFITLTRIGSERHRPGFYKTQLKLLKRGMTEEALKNVYKDKKYFYTASTFYRFGPKPKEVFDKHFTPQTLSSIAKSFLKEIKMNTYYDYI
jgi:hypothetical protein